MQLLVLTLAAPMASFGFAPGNAERGTSDRPGRSALLGLAGAALGFERADEARQAALCGSFSTASRTLRAGTLLRDFHTYQSVPRAKGRFRTRRLALASGEATTSITRRDYRVDGLWQAAYISKPTASLSLEDLQQAFKSPKFTLFAGRKSCTLSMPLGAQLVEEPTLHEAFLAHAVAHALPMAHEKDLIATDDADLLPLSYLGGNQPIQHNRRMDSPISRKSWQFAVSDEWVYLPSQPGD